MNLITFLFLKIHKLRNRSKNGFTLIEMSIVLVVIGLLIGGVLVGQNLIKAAEARAQVSQVEKLQTAVATFREKYNYLPGDITSAAAAQFGFVTRSGAPGRGDGNGEIDGWATLNNSAYAYNLDGETLFFWEDLSSAKLIDQTFNTYVDAGSTQCTLSATCSSYYPTAKIGGENFIYVYSGYATSCPGGSCVASAKIGPNFFGLSVTAIGTNSNVGASSSGTSNPGLTVAQAYAIDIKIDDGLPTTGKVLAQYLTSTVGHPGFSTNAATDSATTCFNSSTNVYSVTQSNGANVNCGLSFQFQTGD